MTKTAQSRAAEVDRRGRANQLNPAAQEFYHDHWRVRNLADIEDEAGEFDHTGTKGALELLEYAGIDILVDTYDAQYGVQEKFVYPNTPGDALLIRMNNGSETVASEAEKLRAMADPDERGPVGMMPTHIGFGKARDWSAFEWFMLLDVAAFADRWHTGEIAPTRVYRNDQDGTESLLFQPEDISDGAIVAEWGDRDE